jgi:hypothetical protein
LERGVAKEKFEKERLDKDGVKGGLEKKLLRAAREKDRLHILT